MKIICDGKLLVWRGNSINLSNSLGQRTSAVYSFLKTILGYHKQFGVKPAVAWEGGSKHRKILLPTYKGDREKNEDIEKQVVLIKEMFSYLGVEQFLVPDFEADDVLYSFAKKYKQTDEVIVITADSDLYQVIDDKVKMYNPFTQKFVDKVDVFTKEGVFPEKIAFKKAVLGDSSDNIEGVKRLSRKYIYETINKFKDPNEMFQYEGSICENVREKVCKGKEMILKNYDVTTLREVELKYLYKPFVFDHLNLYNFLKRMEFRSYLDHFDELVQFGLIGEQK